MDRLPHSRKSSGPHAGFSLITMSIILTMASLVMVATITGDDAGNYNKKAMTSIQRLQKVEAATQGFMAAYGRRPCPADGQYDINASGFGMEAATPGICTGGTPTAPLGPDASTYIVGGVIPTKTLGLPDDYAFDEWGRRFTYVVDIRATKKNTCNILEQYNTVTGNHLGKGGIIIHDGSGAAIDNVMYAYISHGPDGHGAFPPQGSSVANRINVGSTDADTLTNASVNSDFSVNFSNVKVRKEKAPTFDDILYYADTFKNTCCIGAVCTSLGFRIDGYGNFEAGASVAVADINGDGIPDLILGAPNLNVDGCPGYTCGGIFVVFGTKNGFPDPLPLTSLNGTNGFRIGQNEFGPFARAAGANGLAVGDVNGDGIADIVFSAPADGSGATTHTWVIFGHNGSWPADIGTNSLDDGTLGARLDGTETPSSSSAYDFTAVAVGDINGDGFEDIIMGPSSGFYDGSGSTYHAYIVYGHAGVWTSHMDLTKLRGTSTGFRIVGKSLDDKFGALVATGDVNGDGIADMVFTSVGAGHPEDYGVIWVVYGKRGKTWADTASIDSLSDGVKGSELLNGWTQGQFAGSIAFGDFDGDRITDMAYSAPIIAWCGCGIASIVYGTGGKWPASMTLDNSNTYGFIGGGNASATIAAGDLDGDGLSDLIIGDSTAPNGGNDSGSVYIVFGTLNTNPGKAGWHSLDNDLTPRLTAGTDYIRIDGSYDGEHFGGNTINGRLLITGDINGDGRPELIMGMPYMFGNGGAYVLYGRKHRSWPATFNLGDF